METKEAIEAVIEEYGIAHAVEWAAGVINEKHEHIKALEQVRDHAYHERNRLAAFLSHLYPSGTKATNIPGWDKEWHGCVYVDLPTGQVSWHYHERETHLFSHLPPYEKEWDEHSNEEKYDRLACAALEKNND